MNKDKLKIIFDLLPLRLKMVCYSIYRSMIVSRVYNSPDHFPLNYINNLNLPIFGISSKIGFFYRLYQEKRSAGYVLPENLFDHKYEIIYGEHKNNALTLESPKIDSIVPICIESENSSLTLKNCDTDQENTLKNLPESRFHYFKVNEGESYNFSSDSKKGFILGRPIPLRQKTRHKKKLVLCIFIDGLADSSQIKDFNQELVMPNTSSFFSKGVKFRNHFSNAEWTLPSVPSFFSGGRQQFHGFHNPKANHVIGEDFKILSEIFQENEYLTFQSSGNWRASPAYGYVKGFDRTVYKKEMHVNEVLNSFFEHMRTFKERDNFVWLTLMDVHHLINIIPDISNQVNNSIPGHRVTPWHDKGNKEKSVFTSADEHLTEIYVNEIKRVDYYLKTIYDYIEDNYENEEIVVSLVSDHGQGFLTNEQNPICIGRTKVPWMIRGGDIPQKESYELTENIDFFNSILSCSDLDIPENDSESICPSVLGGSEDRKFVITQSIYPGQTYKAILRDGLFEYEYESKDPVSINGQILSNLVFNKKNPMTNAPKGFDDLENIEKYRDIIEKKVIEWNTRKSQ